MKKLIVFEIMAVVLTAAVSFAEQKECTSVREAKKLIELNRQSDAKACLDDLKTDVEANYLLGVIYFQENNLSAAKDRFSAPAVRSSKGGEIFKLYKSAGDSYANQENFTGAGNNYEEALAYKADARQTIALDMFERGKSTGKRGYFTVANRLDSSFGQKAADHINAQIQGTKSVDKKIELLEDAANLDKKYEITLRTTKEAEGRGNLEKAKIFARKVGQETATEKYKALARKYLGEAVLEEQLPEVVEYAPRAEMYVFWVKKGEQTNHWIEIQGNNQQYLFVRDNECVFDIVCADGRVIKTNETITPEHGRKFKLRAINNCAQEKGGIGLQFK